MEDTPRGPSNPFISFYTQVQSLIQLNFVKSLQEGDPTHRLYRAVETLQRVTVDTARETAWHGPGAAAPYLPFGSNPRTSFGGAWTGSADYRPRTPNTGTAGLHPGSNYPSPPSTPNGDPLSNRRSYLELANQNAVYAKKFERYQDDLRAEKQAHQDTRTALDDSREQIARLQSETALLQSNADQLHTQLADAKRTIEDVHKEAAKLCKEQKNYWDAATHFSKLSQLKLDEAKAFDDCNDVDAANNAENSALNFQRQKGEMLDLDSRYADAETEFRRILSRRKQLFGPDHIKWYKESRDTMLNLARVLRKQHDVNKTMEAERLYGEHANLINFELQDEKSREWAFRNALGLTSARYERQAYRYAKQILSYIWENRSNVPASYVSELDTEALRILDLLRCRDHKNALIDALRIICKSDPAEVGSQFLPCYIELGTLLSAYPANSSSQSHHDEALSYIEDVWRCRDRLSVEQRRIILWSMALIYASLFSASPTKDMISALTALLQLNAGEFASAEKTATPLVVVARDTKHNITAITTSNLLSPYTPFHQTDTLLKALTKRRQREYFEKAKAIWDQVYNAVKRREIADSNEIKMFAATGGSLADEWLAARRNCGTRLESPGEIKRKVEDMERWAAANAGNASSRAV
ncbi:hypothetical protein DV737_g2029, partial [Chaetothyriales sp. CBS 132003]